MFTRSTDLGPCKETGLGVSGFSSLHFSSEDFVKRVFGCEGWVRFTVGP